MALSEIISSKLQAQPWIGQDYASKSLCVTANWVDSGRCGGDGLVKEVASDASSLLLGKFGPEERD
jgi:hypothetical protein